MMRRRAEGHGRAQGCLGQRDAELERSVCSAMANVGIAQGHLIQRWRHFVLEGEKKRGKKWKEKEEERKEENKHWSSAQASIELYS